MKTALSLLTFAALVSCQPIGGYPGSPPTGGPGVIDVWRPDTLIGRPLPAAQAACRSAGLRCRVVEVDGQPLPVTMDYRPDRLNFKVRNGIVIDVTKG